MSKEKKEIEKAHEQKRISSSKVSRVKSWPDPPIVNSVRTPGQLTGAMKTSRSGKSSTVPNISNQPAGKQSKKKSG